MNQMQIIFERILSAVFHIGSVEDNDFGNWKHCWGALPSLSPPL